MTDTDLRYPIGQHDWPKTFSNETRSAALRDIEQMPALLRAAVSGLSDGQLDTPYRPDGWTARQVVHHVADAHMVMSTRVRTALTEDNPPVKTWDEESWAELADMTTMPIDGSLSILDAVHERLGYLLRTLTDAQWRRTMSHPAWSVISIDALVSLWAWHGKHHTAHVAELRRRSGW